MSEIELYGLMAIAQEHQNIAEKAGKQAEAASVALVQAVAMHRQSVGELSKAAQEAIAEAVRGQSTQLAAPMRDAAQKVTEAALAASRSLSGVVWWVYAAVFLAGLVAGAVGWGWYQARQASQVVAVDDVIRYLQENPQVLRPKK